MSDIGMKAIMDGSITSTMNLKRPPQLEGLRDEKLMKASKEFEEMFLNLVFKSMRESTTFESDVMGDSKSQKIYQELLDNEYAKNSSGRFGIAEALYEQISRANGVEK